jgi:hypothetical protein
LRYFAEASFARLAARHHFRHVRGSCGQAARQLDDLAQAFCLQVGQSQGFNGQRTALLLAKVEMPIGFHRQDRRCRNENQQNKPESDRQ